MSTRSVDDLVKVLGADSGVSKSKVSRICGELDAELDAFRERPLDHTVFPYVFLDATYCKARVNHRIVSQAVVIATGISPTGHREILGLMVGDSESKPSPEQGLRLTSDGDSLTAQKMFDVLDATSLTVKLSEDSRKRMQRFRDVAINGLASGTRVYGWNQALGPLKDKQLKSQQQKEFQKRILRSHAAGVGQPLPELVTRLIMLLRAHQMAGGHMAVRPELVNRINSLVNAGVTLAIPQVGSLSYVGRLNAVFVAVTQYTLEERLAGSSWIGGLPPR